MKNSISNFLTIWSILFTLSACQSEPDYKAIRQQVLDQHDQVMIDGERAMSNKMKLDTLGSSGLAVLKKQQPGLDTAAERTQINALSRKLTDADDQMNDWMHNFKTDMDGKSNEESVKYFESEKVKIQKLDSIYKAALKESGAYMQKFNIRPDTGAKGMEHMKM